MANGRNHMVSSIDVGHQGGKFVFERISHKTLGGKVIAFVGFYFSNHVKDTCKTFNRTGMNFQSGQDGFNSGHSVLLIFNGRAPDDAVDLITFLQEQFSQVTPILPGNPGYQSALHPMDPFGRKMDNIDRLSIG